MYPGLDISWPGDAPPAGADSRAPGEDPMAGLVLATVDECAPIAVSELTSGVRVFFNSGDARQQAAALLAATLPHCTCVAVDVPDEHWAERSQASLRRVTVGTLTVAPPWDLPDDRAGLIIIQPSMGFGTGHHASTRLCLRLLQDSHVPGTRVLDVGTGSGVLAIAAWRLHAASVVAIDFDPDAVTCARECAELNGIAAALDIRQCDLERVSAVEGEPFSLLLANLTGGMLVRLASRLLELMTPGGTLIVSGVTREEEDVVTRTFEALGATVTGRALDDLDQAWVGLRFTSPTSPPPPTSRP